MKKIAKYLVLLLAAVVLVACGNSDDGSSAEGSESKGYVGISMPTKSSERWIDDGNNLVEKLEAEGYETDLQYGEDKVENQVAQIENMITKGADYLVIAPIDGAALTDVVDKAAEEGIRVIAYDRLIMNTENIDYYITFDNKKVGEQMAQYIVDALDLENTDESFNVELFAGSPDDNNATVFYSGSMEVLDPYIESGQVVVKSGQTDFNQIATLRWDGSTAQARMDNLLSANYTDERVDAILSPIDQMSLGIISSFKGVGYGTEEQPLPVVTGQDATIAGIKSIIQGEQTSTIFKDTRLLADSTIEIINAIQAGEEDSIEVTDTESYDNGVKVVPSQLSEPVVVDADNYQETMIDSGYYTEDELK